jgi:hypothetical protein
MARDGGVRVRNTLEKRRTSPWKCAQDKLRLARFERATYGLGNRPAGDTSSVMPMTSDCNEIRVADCVAFLAENRPDLAAVVEAWDRLPDAIRQGIVAMVRAAK